MTFHRIFHLMQKIIKLLVNSILGRIFWSDIGRAPLYGLFDLADSFDPSSSVITTDVRKDPIWILRMKLRMFSQPRHTLSVVVTSSLRWLSSRIVLEPSISALHVFRNLFNLIGSTLLFLHWLRIIELTSLELWLHGCFSHRCLIFTGIRPQPIIEILNNLFLFVDFPLQIFDFCSL